MRFHSFDLLATVFSASCLPLLFLASLPSMTEWYIVACSLLLIATLSFFILKSYLVVCAIFLLGFLWSTAYAKRYLNTISPYIDQTLSVTAKVDSANTFYRYLNQEDKKHYVQFEILQIDDNSIAQNLPVSVFWDKEQQPMAGQLWHLTIKTKVVHSYLNEGGFDSQRFAITNRTLLSAKLVEADLVQDSFNLKQTIINHALPYIEIFSYQDIMLALAFGDRSHLTEENRLIMMQTGIAHLMAISGMHIILVFMMSSFIAKSGLFFLPMRFIHYGVPIALGWLCALFYAWLSGLNPPAMRAILALSIWIILRYKNSQLSAWQKVNRIIAILLFFDPLMILSESFWLSCYAVSSLIFLFQWMPLPDFMQHKKRWYLVRLLHLQFGLTLLLLPIQLFVFQGVSSVSLIANLIAIPIVSLLTFPAIFLALLFSCCDLFHLALWFWFVAEQSLELLFCCLKWFDFSWINFSHHFSLLSIIGWLIIIAWRTGYWRHFFVTSTVIILLLISPFFKNQDYVWRLDMLDVGHGLAIVIHNGHSAILYDTGAKWENSSAAERVIIPFLKWHNLQVEGIIISHQHNDHIGGLELIQHYYADAWLMSTSTKLNNNYQCITGNKIVWNNLTFNVLWPDKSVDYAQNEDSCVIKLTDDLFSILLTGDLERQQEYLLVTKYREQLSSTFLQMPHHGSSTSSSYTFLHHVAPQVSLASTSRYNPWKLPSYKVISRYEELHLPYYVTAKTGQISLFFTEEDWTLKTMREKIKPRWYHSWFGELPNYE